MHSVEAFEISKKKLPNFKSKQIPIISKLNYEAWNKYPSNYWDHQLPLLIKYGFPLNISEKPSLKSNSENHKSATDFAKHVDSYIAEEVVHGVLAGP